MKKTAFIFLLFPVVLFCQNKTNILPTPQSVSQKKGEFKAPEIVNVYADIRFKYGIYLLDALNTYAQILPVPSVKKAKKGIAILFVDTFKNPESYVLEISKKGVKIMAGGDAGAFYALQSLRQLRKSQESWLHDGFDFKPRKLGNLPCLKISDAPAFGWRGMHLDVSRHFFTVANIKKYLDIMAMHKMNVFHWHLVDDQGWRIAIDAFPKLTEVGAWRNGSMVGAYQNYKIDSVRYGGFYSKADIKEVVAYAAKLFITVVPEIEMPGHSLAAVASYPWLSCTGMPQDVAKSWGGFADVFCAGNDSVLQFMQTVLDEVLPLFPSKYIHIGGDECEKKRWKTCVKCQKRMADEKLKDENELQSYFIRRMERYLNDKGRILIGWDEILEGGLAPNAVVMSWRGTAGGEEAVKQGHKVVMSPGKPCYFDHYQSKDSTEPHAIGGFNPLSAVYNYRPVPESVLPSEAKLILGAQANLWTEYINTWEHLEYMAWPRGIALADGLWKGGNRDGYAKFLNALDLDLKRLEYLKINYAKSHYKN